VWVQETLDGAAHLAEAEPGTPTAPSQEAPLTQTQREAHGQQALGLTPETARDEIPEQVLRIRETARQAQAKIDDFASTREPTDDHDARDLGPAWNIEANRDRDAILQPPKPDVVPASKILERAEARQAAMEPELE
jgi:hypothetical protein